MVTFNILLGDNVYRKRKKIEKKYIILIIILFITVFIDLAIKIVNPNRKLTLPEKVIKDSVLFVNKIVYVPISYISSKIDKIIEKNNIYEKYKELLKDKELIESIKIKNEELENELEKLKQILEINKTLSENSYLNASVINRNLDYFSNTLTIDKGSENGIEEGLAVTFNGSLIGKIIKVSNFTSTVKLLTTDDINNKISVKINNNDKYIYGLITGYKKGNLLVSGIDTNDEIVIGSNVVTTGLGGMFPSGILVGKVKGITKDNFDLATTILVKSEIDFNDINFVTVLKRINQ